MNTEIKHHYLSAHSLSTNLSKDQMNDLCSLAVFRTADKGANIYFESDSDKRVCQSIGVVWKKTLSKLSPVASLRMLGSRKPPSFRTAGEWRMWVKGLESLWMQLLKQ